LSISASVDESPLLERERELATLERLLAAARAGRGGFAVIEGDAGVGKSRLLLAAGASARAADMRVLRATGSELECDYAFGVVGQLFDDGFSNVTGTDGEAHTLSVIVGLHDRLRSLAVDGAALAPVLVAVDDAQWADEPSLRFLAHLALRVVSLPVAVIVTVRTGEETGSSGLLASLKDHRGVEVLAPAPLSETASAAMVSDALGERDPELVAACFRATGGNPFYLSELLRVLAGEADPRPERVGNVAPAAVLRSVVVRLARIGPQASALARATAVLGDGAPLRLTASLAELPEPQAESAADALCRAGILHAGEPLRFAHPLIASALEADMGAFERARAHRRAAALLHAEGAVPERVAAHLLLARPQREAEVVEILAAAAERAVANGVPAAAGRFLARALEEPPEPGREPELLLSLAKAEAIAGTPAAPERLERALARIPEPEQRAEALAELATFAHLRWDVARAAELAARGQRELPDDHPLREHLLGIELGASALHPELLPGMEQRLAPIMAAACDGRAPSDPRLLALVIGWLGIVATPELIRSLAEKAVSQDPLMDESYGTSIGWIAAALEWVDELEFAESWLGRAVDAADRRGAVIAGSTALMNRARMRFYRGRLEGAIEDGERALDTYRFGWTNSAWGTHLLARAHAARGDLDEARAALAIGERAGVVTPEHGRLLEARAHLLLAEDDVAGALATAREAGAFIKGRLDRNQARVWEWRRLGALAAHRLGDDDLARELLAPDLESLREIGPPRILGEALTVAGMIAGGEEGLALLAEAADLVERSPARLSRAQTLLALGAALRRDGQRTAAKAPLQKALELASDMGASALEREARDELGRLGLRPRRTALAGLESLTPSERQIAELASNGLTTPQIAARLHITANTVDTHLRHVYRKLEVSGRRELPAVLAGLAR
jgi:DNA-binding CsgD family transcriptional regulator